ncbi:15008_t:CDS:2 [Rhizophagus irregularis]|nr:15008_t:CDS:2 [Rhizophagus irregularis]
MDHIVVATYVEECNQAVFSDIKAGTWDWIDCHSQICKYSVDFRKCEDRNYK